MTRLPALALAAALILTSSTSVQAASAPPEGQVRILNAGGPLTASETAALEESGTRVLRPMGSGRYLVRVEGGEVSARSGMPQLNLQRIDPAEKRMGVSGALLSSGGQARLDVYFYDDVTFEQARAAVVAAGGAPVDPLQTGFGFVRSIEAVLDRSAVDALAAGNLAQLIRDRPRDLQSNNATAAALSKVDVARETFGLTGEGVVVSVYEISPLQTDHPEFEGRATGPSGTPEAHATHVAGTVAAAGLQPSARGMAPEATVVGHVVDLSFVDRKAESFMNDRAAADNNSWSFVVGWNYDSSRSLNWEWFGFVDEFGAYSPETAALDELSLARQTLMVYSAGNDNTDAGPSIAPFAHYHGNRDEVWCVSSDASGNDCPTELCGTRCEATRHPADGPWTTMSLIASMKNGLAVGAVTSTRQIASFSSRGPARDGRVKPDVVAKGLSLYSLTKNGGYTSMQGTSMAAPVVTGVAALLSEQWRGIFGGPPRPEMLRALIIHGTDDLGEEGPDYTYGFGLVNALRSSEILDADRGGARRVRTGVVAQADRWSVPVEFTAGDEIRLSLVWNDTPNVAYTTPALVNDLNLSLVAPDGRRIHPWTLDPATPDAPAVRGVNRVDNAERIDWTADVTGSWRIEVDGSGVSTPHAQAFVLLSSLDMGSARLACDDPFEPNETEATAVGEFPDRQSIRASICGGSDRDFYRFTVRRSGVVSATITSEVPVRITLRSGGSILASVDAAAGATRQVTASVGGSTPGQPISPQTVILSVEPLADAEGEYVLRTARPDEPVNRGRGVRR